MTDSAQTPRAGGFTFPAEWERHAATWLSWPRPGGVSFPGRYEPVLANFVQIVREIAAHERVEMNVGDDADLARAQDLLRGRNVGFHHIRTDECWCRDHGPAFLVNRAGPAAAVVDWDFNAWGRKHPAFADDDAAPTRIAAELHLPVFYPGIVMEGGSIDVNGAGALLTTESCLLNPNRNPTLSQSQIEQYLRDYYGQRQICWLGQGLAGDDTDGHVDDLARFIDARTIVTAVEQDPRDVNYAALRDNRQRLERLKDPDGRAFEIVEVPMPGVVEQSGRRLPATYVNFYFINGALLVPTFGQAGDRAALEILARLVPGRRVIGMDCTQVIWGCGAIHCLTQQQPEF